MNNLIKGEQTGDKLLIEELDGGKVNIGVTVPTDMPSITVIKI